MHLLLNPSQREKLENEVRSQEELVVLQVEFADMEGQMQQLMEELKKSQKNAFFWKSTVIVFGVKGEGRVVSSDTGCLSCVGSLKGKSVESGYKVIAQLNYQLASLASSIISLAASITTTQSSLPAASNGKH
ncbi:hypothetical protein Tco_0537941 [Tanacetum coccineum]